MKDLEKKAEAFMREELNNVLGQCTSEQRSFFLRLYPHGPMRDQLSSAYGLCVRTIKANPAPGPGGEGANDE